MNIMNEEKEIEKVKAVVDAYCKTVGTQDPAEFRNLWTGKHNTLISVGKLFEGLDSITEDFILGGIKQAYTKIDLIQDDINVRLIDDTHALVIFRYHTECIRRESGEPYGISGLETQLIVKTDDGWKLQHIHYSKV